MDKNGPVALKKQRTIEASKVSHEFVDDVSLESLNDKVGSLSSSKILITTSRRASRTTILFASELSNVFPYGHFAKRGSLDRVEDVIRDASNQNFSVLAVVGESSKKPNSLTFVILPLGPTFGFKLSSVKVSKSISKRGRPSDYSPELILSNMTTGAGRLIGRFFMCLFPPPEFKGRQVVSFLNQRDFIFFRRHRYIFDKDEKRNVRIQELGPQFTLKLKCITSGAFNAESSESIYSDVLISKEKKAMARNVNQSVNNKLFAL